MALPALGLAAAAGAVLWQLNKEGCEAFTPSSQPLIAHAGGGLPNKFYANSFEAMNLAVEHGFELIELDFLVSDGALVVGHDEGRISEVTLASLKDWLDAHPGVSIVTDIKSGNQYLPTLREQLGTDQVIPQIYSPSQYTAVRSLGFERIIFTSYRMGRDDWQSEANALDLFAVTIPADRLNLANGVNHPVYLHTVNEPVEGFGLYTQCLVPA